MTSFADPPKATVEETPALTAEQIVDQRFFNSQNGRVADESDKALMALIGEKVKGLARTIYLDVPAGPNREISLKALEDVQMRAILAILYPVG